MRLHRPQTLALALRLLGVRFKLNKPQMLSLPAYSFRQERMAKILGPLGKGLLRGSVGQGIKRIGGLYGEELATETATQMGQGQEEANVGLRDTAPGVWDAFKEIGPATFWQTTLMRIRKQLPMCRCRTPKRASCCWMAKATSFRCLTGN